MGGVGGGVDDWTIGRVLGGIVKGGQSRRVFVR